MVSAILHPVATARTLLRHLLAELRLLLVCQEFIHEGTHGFGAELFAKLLAVGALGFHCSIALGLPGLPPLLLFRRENVLERCLTGLHLLARCLHLHPCIALPHPVALRHGAAIWVLAHRGATFARCPPAATHRLHLCAIRCETFPLFGREQGVELSIHRTRPHLNTRLLSAHRFATGFPLLGLLGEKCKDLRALLRSELEDAVQAGNLLLGSEARATRLCDGEAGYKNQHEENREAFHGLRGLVEGSAAPLKNGRTSRKLSRFRCKPDADVMHLCVGTDTAFAL